MAEEAGRGQDEIESMESGKSCVGYLRGAESIERVGDVVRDVCNEL